MEIKTSPTRIDGYRHQGMRKRLIETLKKKGISNEPILEAMRRLPRHFFLDSAFSDHAYEDKAFPIACDQTISQPYTVAYMTELLLVQPNQKILEIGTGSGYQAAILSLLGADVYSVERQDGLFQKTKSLLGELGFEKIHLFHGDGTLGLSQAAPFDRIIVTAGAPVIPEDLMAQLQVGGILVIPVGEKAQIMTRFTKTGADTFTKELFGDFRFVPLLPNVT